MLLHRHSGALPLQAARGCGTAPASACRVPTTALAGNSKQADEKKEQCSPWPCVAPYGGAAHLVPSVHRCTSMTNGPQSGSDHVLVSQPQLGACGASTPLSPPPHLRQKDSRQVKKTPPRGTRFLPCRRAVVHSSADKWARAHQTPGPPCPACVENLMGGLTRWPLPRLKICPLCRRTRRSSSSAAARANPARRGAGAEPTVVDAAEQQPHGSRGLPCLGFFSESERVRGAFV